MSEQKGLHEHLKDIPNPNPEGKTRGPLEKFRYNAGQMGKEALRRTREQIGLDPLEYEVEEWPDGGERR